MRDEILILNVDDSWINCIENKRLKYYIIENVMSFCIFYPFVGLFVGYYSEGYTSILGGLIAIFTTILMNICLKKINNQALRFFSQVTIPIGGGFVLYFFYNNLTVRCIVLVYYILVIGSYFINITKKETKIKGFSYIIFGEIVLTAIYILAGGLKINNIEVPIIICALVLASLSIFYVSSSRIECLLEQEKQYTYNSMNKVIKVNSFLSIVLSLMLLAAYFIIYYILTALGFENFINKLLAGKNVFQVFTESIVQTDYKLNYSNNKMNVIKNEAPAVSEKTQHFWQMFNTVIMCILIATAVFLILKKLVNMYKNLNNLNSKNELSERVIAEEQKDESVLSKFDILSKFMKLNISNRARVRREYYKFISTHSKGKVKIENDETPFEIDKKIGNILNVEIKEVTVLYEKARYGKAEIDSQELKNLKLLIRDKNKRA